MLKGLSRAARHPDRGYRDRQARGPSRSSPANRPSSCPGGSERGLGSCCGARRRRLRPAVHGIRRGRRRLLGVPHRGFPRAPGRFPGPSSGLAAGRSGFRNCGPNVARLGPNNDIVPPIAAKTGKLAGIRFGGCFAHGPVVIVEWPRSGAAWSTRARHLRRDDLGRHRAASSRRSPRARARRLPEQLGAGPHQAHLPGSR